MGSYQGAGHRLVFMAQPTVIWPCFVRKTRDRSDICPVKNLSRVRNRQQIRTFFHSIDLRQLGCFLWRTSSLISNFHAIPTSRSPGPKILESTSGQDGQNVVILAPITKELQQENGFSRKPARISGSGGTWTLVGPFRIYWGSLK